MPGLDGSLVINQDFNAESSPAPNNETCPKTITLDADADAATEDKCTGASEPPNSPVVNKISEEYEEDASTSKMESIKAEFAGTPLIKLSPGKPGKRVEAKTPSLKPDSVNRTEGESEAGTEEHSVPKATSHFDEDTSGDPDLKLPGGCKIQNSLEMSAARIERTNVKENGIPAKAELPPVQQCSSPDESEALDVPPEPQEKTEQLATEDKALVEAKTQSEPSVEKEVSQSTCLGDGDASFSNRHLMPKTSCGTSAMAAIAENEEFRSPREILGMNIELDYLEQFGMASFKESAWRKQSLYLKFDPLLIESPKKMGPPTVATVPAVPALVGQGTEIPPHEIKNS
ncbi:UNVERIFIED_CONTAM: hypothetical protein K2H54_010815 [Gekko kuhli]